MPEFSVGDPVLFVPPHADTREHDDCVPGVVKEVRETGLLVNYEDDSPVAKMTKRRLLVPRFPEPDEPPFHAFPPESPQYVTMHTAWRYALDERQDGALHDPGWGNRPVTVAGPDKVQRGDWVKRVGRKYALTYVPFESED